MTFDVDRFHRRLAHDITGTVGVVGSALDEAFRERDNEERTARFRQMAERGLRRLLRVAELLRLVTELAEGGEVEISPAAASDLVRDAVDHARALEARRGIDVTCNDSPDARLMVDRRLLTIALREITQNAIAHAKATVSIQVRTEGDTIQFDVQDDGRGFPSQALPAGSPAANPRGLGVGLSIAADITRRLGGLLSIEGASDDEARFSRVRLALPAA